MELIIVIWIIVPLSLHITGHNLTLLKTNTIMQFFQIASLFFVKVHNSPAVTVVCDVVVFLLI